MRKRNKSFLFLLLYVLLLGFFLLLSLILFLLGFFGSSDSKQNNLHGQLQSQLASQPQTHPALVPKKTAVVAPQVTTDTFIAPAPPVVKPVQDEIASLVKPVKKETSVDFYLKKIHTFLNQEGYDLTYLQHHLPEIPRLAVHNLAKAMLLYEHEKNSQTSEVLSFCLENFFEAFPLVRQNYELVSSADKKDDGDLPFLMATSGKILKFCGVLMDTVSDSLKQSAMLIPSIGVPRLA